MVCISGYYKYLNFENGGSGQKVIMKIIVSFLQYYEDIFSQEEHHSIIDIIGFGCRHVDWLHVSTSLCVRDPRV